MRVISGIYKRRRFDVPRTFKARPTTDFAKENLFNVLNNYIDFEEGVNALDLFAGTGAVTFELLSRGAASVTAVEKASTQYSFIAKVAKILDADNLRLVRGDALRFIATYSTKFDFIFADPPYDMEGFAEIPQKILDSAMLHPGTLFIIEHSRRHDFSGLPHFMQHREYGSVNFSIFRIPESD